MVVDIQFDFLSISRWMQNVAVGEAGRGVIPHNGAPIAADQTLTVEGGAEEAPALLLEPHTKKGIWAEREFAAVNTRPRSGL